MGLKKKKEKQQKKKQKKIKSQENLQVYILSHLNFSSFSFCCFPTFSEGSVRVASVGCFSGSYTTRATHPEVFLLRGVTNDT